MATAYNSISANKNKTWLIMIGFVIFFLVVSYVIGYALDFGLYFVGIMLIISGVMTFISYYNSDKIVLSMANAKPADKKTYHHLYTSVENLSIASGLPMPKVYIIDDAAPNAFATGRDPKHAAVAATTGLLSILEPIELEGVIGHELSHVKNYDTRLMGVVAILVGTIAIMAHAFMHMMWFGGGRGDNRQGGGHALIMVLAIVFAILAPILSTIIQLAISRRREFLADADGALLTRYPEGLARALEKIASSHRPVKHANVATAHFYIENPLKKEKKSGMFSNLFSTHPSVADRVRILRGM